MLSFNFHIVSEWVTTFLTYIRNDFWWNELWMECFALENIFICCGWLSFYLFEDSTGLETIWKILYVLSYGQYISVKFLWEWCSTQVFTPFWFDVDQLLQIHLTGVILYYSSGECRSRILVTNGYTSAIHKDEKMNENLSLIRSYIAKCKPKELK